VASPCNPGVGGSGEEAARGYGHGRALRPEQKEPLPPDLKADWSIESDNHPAGYISLFRFCSAVADSRQALLYELLNSSLICIEAFFEKKNLNSDYCLFKSEHEVVYCCKDICVIIHVCTTFS
jgi:hypothetical protein